MLSWQLFNFFCIVFVTLEVTLKDTSFHSLRGRVAEAFQSLFGYTDGMGTVRMGAEVKW
jgi:hypothetical protein